MKIKRIKIENNPILGNKVFNFEKNNGEIEDTILLIGENGSGKTTFLNMIYNITSLHCNNPNLVPNEVRIFNIFDETLNREFSIILDSRRKNNISIINKEKDFWATTSDIVQNFSDVGEECNESIDGDELLTNYEKHVFVEIDGRYDEKLTQKILSEVSYTEVKLFSSYLIPEINDIGAKNTNISVNDLSYTITGTSKVNEELSQNIKTLLIALCSADNEDVVNYVKNHPRRTVPVDIIDTRINFLKNAINILFSDSGLQFFGLKKLKPIFIKDNNEIEIDKLSLGEREIIYKGGFLLKNIGGNKGKIILIDEPEMGLHPFWQKKIYSFYKKILSYGENSSQVFISTHSPYVLQDAYENQRNIITFPSGENIKNLRAYIGKKPSLSVINYLVYNLPNIELHDELYGYIQVKSKKYGEKDLEKYFSNNGFSKDKKRAKKNGNLYDVTSQTFIRNKIHHPENQFMQNTTFTDEELKKSIKKMITFIDSQGW